MELTVIADLISAFAALCAIAITVVELIFRSVIHKTDSCVEIYAEYLYIVQQIECGVYNFRSLIKNTSAFNLTEKNAYALTHSINENFFDTIHEFEKKLICNANYNHGNNDNSKLFIDFLSESLEVVRILNSCYSIVINKGNIDDTDSMNNYHILIDQYYLSWTKYKDQVAALLLSKLSTVTKPIYKYVIWIIIAVVLIVALIAIIMTLE